MIKPRNILVAGGAGKLGHKCVKLLLKQKHKVICVDNFSNPDGSKKLERIKPYLENLNFYLITRDLAEYEEMYFLFQRYEIDAIIYLAGTNSNEFSRTMKDNFLAFATMFDLSRKFKVKGLISIGQETSTINITEQETASALARYLTIHLNYTYEGILRFIPKIMKPKEIVETTLNIVESSTKEDNI